MKGLDKVKELLQKVPFGVLLGAYLGYLGYQYYTFTTDPESELIQKRAQAETISKGNLELQAKVKKANDFFKSLDGKRLELRKLAKDLEELKGTVTTSIDVSDFMRSTTTEAKKVGLFVIGIQPGTYSTKEYYGEQPFTLGFRGVYVQLLVFLERLAAVREIVRVDNFELKPVGSSLARFVELDGLVEIKAYKYLASKADDIGAAPTSAAPAAAPKKEGGK